MTGMGTFSDREEECYIQPFYLQMGFYLSTLSDRQQEYTTMFLGWLEGFQDPKEVVLGIISNTV